MKHISVHKIRRHIPWWQTSIILPCPTLTRRTNKRMRPHVFRHLYTISEEGWCRILSELGMPKSSSADCQELHTVSTTCCYTVTIITVPANNVSICFVLFTSRRYQRLTLYSVECNCWTTKWTRFVRHEVFCGFLRIQGFLFVIPRRVIGN